MWRTSLENFRSSGRRKKNWQWQATTIHHEAWRWQFFRSSEIYWKIVQKSKVFARLAGYLEIFDHFFNFFIRVPFFAFSFSFSFFLSLSSFSQSSSVSLFLALVIDFGHFVRSEKYYVINWNIRIAFSHMFHPNMYGHKKCLSYDIFPCRIINWMKSENISIENTRRKCRNSTRAERRLKREKNADSSNWKLQPWWKLEEKKLWKIIFFAYMNGTNNIEKEKIQFRCKSKEILFPLCEIACFTISLYFVYCVLVLFIWLAERVCTAFRIWYSWSRTRPSRTRSFACSICVHTTLEMKCSFTPFFSHSAAFTKNREKKMLGFRMSQ